MIEKKFTKDKCKVTFRLSEKDVKAKSVALLGEFNKWDAKATLLDSVKSKKEFKTTVDLELGKKYEFRYLVDGKDWFNDPNADAVMVNVYGAENFVVNTTK